MSTDEKLSPAEYLKEHDADGNARVRHTHSEESAVALEEDAETLRGQLHSAQGMHRSLRAECEEERYRKERAYRDAEAAHGEANRLRARVAELEKALRRAKPYVHAYAPGVEYEADLDAVNAALAPAEGT